MVHADAHPEIPVAQILPCSHAKVKKAMRGFLGHCLVVIKPFRDIALMEHFGLNISPNVE